jgi:hypothetical protein
VHPNQAVGTAGRGRGGAPATGGAPSSGGPGSSYHGGAGGPSQTPWFGYFTPVGAQFPPVRAPGFLPTHPAFLGLVQVRHITRMPCSTTGARCHHPPPLHPCHPRLPRLPPTTTMPFSTTP